ncbi:MAG: hypothetical protein KVP17_005110 [Porospora cf. gigantea B]|uniref:uncharacterized protein n=1 Tax=Porospora cf. gigantea B TaxID=2853592 RepID=UPI00357193E8|nr:MAG: hypothetical protein KVP17_005110 [Porospora cf. gigantea B]
MDRNKLLGALVKDEKRFKSSAQQALAPYGPQKGYFTEQELCGVINDMAKLFQLPKDIKKQMAADFAGAGNVSMTESLNLYHGWIYFLHDTFDTRKAVSRRANFVGQFEVTEERLKGGQRASWQIRAVCIQETLGLRVIRRSLARRRPIHRSREGLQAGLHIEGRPF